MDFTHDDEQLALRDAVRALLGRAYADFEQRRRAVLADPGFDPAVWSQLAAMGLLGLPFAEEDGGVGAGPVEIGIVCREIGRVLAPEPYLACVVLAGGLVAAAGTPEQRQRLLGPLAAGESILAFAHHEPGRRWQPDAVGVAADSEHRLTGVKDGVLHGVRADVLVVSAALPGGGTGLFLVEGDALATVERDGFATADGGRAARIVLEATPASPLGEPGADATATIAAVQDVARVMAANEALGAMQTQVELTTAYLKSRRQFGVTLNTFQALTFRAADMYTSLELTHSMVDWATMVSAEGAADATADAAARVGLQVSRAGRHIGQEAIQLHGGIGMTAEYSVGAHTARLTALEHLLGDGGHCLRTLDASLGDHAALDPLAPLAQV